MGHSKNTSNTKLPMRDQNQIDRFLASVDGDKDERKSVMARLLLETGVRPSDAAALTGSCIYVGRKAAYLTMPIGKQIKSKATKTRNKFIKDRLIEIAKQYQSRGEYSQADSLLDLTSSKPLIVNGKIHPKKTYFPAVCYPDGSLSTYPEAFKALDKLGLGDQWESIWIAAVDAGERAKIEAEQGGKKTKKNISLELAKRIKALNAQTEDDFVFSSALSKSNNKGSGHVTRQTVWEWLAPHCEAEEKRVKEANQDQVEYLESVGEKVSYSPYSLRKTAAYLIFVEFGIEAASIFLNHADTKVTQRYLMMHDSHEFNMYQTGELDLKLAA